MEENMTNLYINEIHEQSNHYIVIGLTGRCGSGCSTARGILCGVDKFNPEEFLGNININQIYNQDRDQKIILNYARENPIVFQSIKVRDILTSFILDNPDNFFWLLNDTFPDYEGDGLKIKEDFYSFFSKHANFDKNEKQVFEKFAEKNQIIWKKINENVYQFIQDISKEQYDFLFEVLGKVGDIIREFLLKIDYDAYTRIYQHIGNIVRTYGFLNKINDGAMTNANAIHSVMVRINMLIKILRRKEWILSNYEKQGNERNMSIKNSSVCVVIDSIKNVFEADYLKSRYTSFYLMAITLDEERRKQRLNLNKKIDEKQMQIIDAREQPTRAKRILKNYKKSFFFENRMCNDIVGEILFGEKTKTGKLFREAYENDSYLFKMQDVDSCIQKADILINNSGTKVELSLKLMRYVCLMQHPGLIPPTVDERCMQIAQAAKLNSGCVSRHVGAVVSDRDGNILSVGWNDAAASKGNECIGCVRRCFDELFLQEDKKAYSYYELYDPEFRKALRNIMENNIEGGVRKGASDEDVYDKFMESVKSQRNGLPLNFCFKDIYAFMTHDRNQVHTRAQHGEENALEACEKNKCEGGTLYTTSSSCELCAKKALSYNIRRMVYIEPYTGITNNHVLGHMVDHGVDVSRGKEMRRESMNVELFTGATQNAYVKLYTPIFHMKDELKLRGINLSSGERENTENEISVHLEGNLQIKQ